MKLEGEPEGDTGRLLAQEHRGPSRGTPLDGMAAALERPPLKAALWAVAIISLAAVLVHLPARARSYDFSIFYTGAWSMRTGGNPYTESLYATAKRLGLHLGPLKYANHTPTFILAFEPLTLLRPATVYWLWQGLSAAALAAALFLLLRGRRGALVLAPLALLYPPVADNFLYAQFQLILLLMLVAMVRWMERGRDAPAGLMLALAGLLRAFPLGIAGYLLLRRRWAMFMWLCVGMAVGALVTWLMIGPRCLGFVPAARWACGYEFLALPVIVSINAMVSRVFWYVLGPHLSTTVDTVRIVMGMVAELLVLAVTVRATLAMDGRPDRNWRLLSLWIATSIFISPNSQLHYLPLLFIPFVAVAAAAERGSVSRRAVLATGVSYALSVVSCLGMSCVTILGSPQVQNLAHGPAWRVLDFSGWLILAKNECASAAMVLAYIALYWFVMDSLPEAQKVISAA